MTFPSPRRLLLVGALLVTLGIAVLASATSRAATPAKCPASFHVLHDDRIGSMQLPQGFYDITVTGISCGQASGLFTAFLDDWDGKLAKPWRYTVQGVGRGTFIGRGARFSVAKGTSHGPDGQHPASGLVCTQPFTLTQSDRIGPLKLKKGKYLIDRLSALAPNCTQAAVLLGQFLQDFDGKLPNGWVLLPDDASFVRGSVSYGFRLEPWTGHGGGGSGGHRFPSKTTRCGPTFRVLHADHVGRLQFPAGPYWINILKRSNITCRQASSLFASFLARPDGRLPRPWAIDVATGSFTRGRGSPYGFQAKPAFRVR
jgi:hypothetical protein